MRMAFSFVSGSLKTLAIIKTIAMHNKKLQNIVKNTLQNFVKAYNPRYRNTMTDSTVQAVDVFGSETKWQTNNNLQHQVNHFLVQLWN